MKVKRVVRSEYALLALLTLPAVLALLLNSGLPNTADGVLHVFRTFELDRAWRDMVWYPRIAPDFAYGYGYPIFNYYAPLFYFAAEIFHAAGLNLEWAVKTVIVLTFYLYALGMYLLARRWLRPAAAIAAAVAYVYTPYRFYEAFIQGDYPQFLALALVPFCLWAVTPLLAQANPHPNPPPPPRTRSRPSRTTRGTGEGEDTPSSVEEVSERGRLGWGSRYTFAFIAAYTALLLAHNITALIVTPLIGAYMVFLFALDAWHSLRSTAQPGPERSRRPWLEPGRRLAMRAGRVVLAIGLSVGLAAFFWLPALGEQKYVRIERLTRGFFDFRNYFLTKGALVGAGVGGAAGAIYDITR